MTRISGNQPTSKARNTVLKKIGWFAGIWIASILSLAVVAYIIKLVLR